MTVWPKDHPGINCGTCGEAVYTLWVDSTPPPGVCPDQSGAHAQIGACPRVRNRLLTSFVFRKLSGEGGVHPKLEGLMEAAGLTVDDLAMLQARADAIEQERMGLMGALYEVNGEDLRDWLMDENGVTHEARLIALLRDICTFANLANGERTMAELGQRHALLRDEAVQAVQCLGEADYEPDDGGE